MIQAHGSAMILGNLNIINIEYLLIKLEIM